MKMKKVFALLVSVALILSMALPVALTVSDDQGQSDGAASGAAATSSVDEMPTEEGTLEPDAEPEQGDQEQGESQCTCGAAEGEAHKEGCPLYVKPEQPEPAAQAEEALYQKFLATKTMEEANALYKGLSKAELTAFRTWLEENDKLNDLEKHLSAITPEGEPVTMPIVGFTKVGPLLSAPVRRARMMRAAEKTDTGVVLSKKAEIQQDGSYQITMEAFATGSSSTITTSQPVDIVLVLDVSGSMDDYMTQYNAVYTYEINVPFLGDIELIFYIWY